MGIELRTSLYLNLCTIAFLWVRSMTVEDFQRIAIKSVIFNIIQLVIV